MKKQMLNVSAYETELATFKNVINACVNWLVTPQNGQ